MASFLNENLGSCHGLGLGPAIWTKIRVLGMGQASIMLSDLKSEFLALTRLCELNLGLSSGLDLVLASRKFPLSELFGRSLKNLVAY